jgi:7-cyano-7-deazaguanine synthase
MENQKEPVLVLLSGGQDSATCLFWAKAKFGEVHCIAFDYGQRHKIELDAARLMAKLAHAQSFEIVNVPGILSGSSLTDHSKDLNESHEMNKSLPSSFTAGRNILFLTIAASKAFGMGIRRLITGVCETDYSGYPDCRSAFIESMEESLSLGLTGDHDSIKIETPLMTLTKAETWRLAHDTAKELKSELGWEVDVVELIRANTMTDYNGDTTMNEWGMGKEDNPASVLRAKGYREALANGWIEKPVSTW